MAKYKVIKRFTDKYNRTKYKVGDELELTDKRAKEILSVKELIEKISEEKPEKEADKKADKKANKKADKKADKEAEE